MTLPVIPAKQLRTAQGSPLTYLQHDDIHTANDAVLAALVDAVLAMQGSSVPVSTILSIAGTTLTPGFLWANGDTASFTTYADLYTEVGTTYNTGGEPAGTFRLPDLRSRVGMGTNPMGGLTNGSYATRVRGTVYGAQSVAYTPAGAVSQASVGSITATLGAISLGSVTATCGSISIASLTSTVNLTNAPITGAPGVGTLASAVTVADHAAGVTGSTSLNIVAAGGTPTITSETKTGVTVSNSVPCVPKGAEAGTDAMGCGVLTVANFSIDLDTDVVAASLELDPNGHTHTTPMLTHMVTNGAFTGSMTAGTLASSVSVASATIGGSIPTPSVTIGGSIASPAITIGGSIATQTFTGTLASIPVLQPSLALNYIIKY